ncbi:MAG: hypothetical protein AB197_00290 [Parcubacteria bacterium C7867-002]|nr:MAG: hypothetical protein AB197_00290 [Parcubacteria bacterium C7867-002]
MMQKRYNKGFTAVLSIILLALGTFTFALVTMTRAHSYVDMTMRRDMRIQTHLALESCIATIQLMVHKDMFLKGSVHIREFGCQAYIENDYQGNVSLSATSTISGVSVSISSLKL